MATDPAWIGTTRKVSFGYYDTPGTAHAGRLGGGGLCPLPGLLFSGEQNVQYEVYPAAEVSASKTFVLRGDTSTTSFTSHWELTQPIWLFQPNDTAEYGQGTHFAQEICHNAQTCDMTPSVSGRVYLKGMILGAPVTGYGPILWVRDSIPNSCSVPSAVAPVATAAAGESVPFAGPPCPPSEDPPTETVDTVLTIVADSTALHPWVRSFLGTIGVNGDFVPERVGSLTPVRVAVMEDNAPLEGVSVEMSAEFIGAPGGHPHYPSKSPLASAPTVTDQTASGRPLFGYFQLGSERTGSLGGTTDSNGHFDFDFVAGFVGGEMDLIASAFVGNTLFADTVRIVIRVPDLVDVKPYISNAYYIGGTTQHDQGTNWFVRSDIVPRLVHLADLLHEPSATVGGVAGFIQLNDASLPLGGAFTELPQDYGGNEQPFRSHTSHAVGVDIDFSFCVANVSGDDGGKLHRLNASCGDGVSTNYPENELDRRAVRRAAERVGGCVAVHNDNHYHIRFPQHVPPSACQARGM